VERASLKLDEDSKRNEKNGPERGAAPSGRPGPPQKGERRRGRREGGGRNEDETRRGKGPEEAGVQAEEEVPHGDPRHRSRKREVERPSALAHNPRPASLASFLMTVNESLRVLRTLHYDENHYSLFLSAGAIGGGARPGHFAMIQVGEGLRPYLRRAFSIADVTTVAGVPALEFVVKIVGIGTDTLARFAEGTPLPVLGPLGVPFPTDDLLPSDRVALVAGGIGLAPLVFLSRVLAARGIAADLFYGGRNEKDVLKRADFERFLGPHRCRYATDDGSLGRRGRVTELLTSALLGGARYRRAYACGPVAMFRALAPLLAEASLEGSFAMESEMACGFGVCLGCVAPTTDGRFATICKEGPCVPPTQIDWARV
jgi:dihydroorotate dehydrogenase electron transfer subunit